jgi:hypothetical protein
LGIGGIDGVPDAPVRGKEAAPAAVQEERKRMWNFDSFFTHPNSAEALGATAGGVSSGDPAMSELEERLNNLKRN